MCSSINRSSIVLPEWGISKGGASDDDVSIKSPIVGGKAMQLTLFAHSYDKINGC